MEVYRMMKYLTYTWDLVQALESASPASCRTLATLIDFIPPKQLTRKKGKNPEIRFHSQQIVSICSFPPLFQHVDLVTNSLSPGFCVCRRRQYKTTWWE